MTSLRTALTAILLVASLASSAQVYTADIPRFYEAFDALAEAGIRADSVATIQRLYLDRGSEGLRLFDKARDLDPERIVDLVARFPAFYASIREDALAIDRNADRITAVLEEVGTVLPDFEIPPVTIAFGVLNTGGTAVGGHILLGAGLIAGDTTAVVHELPEYVRPLVTSSGGLGDIATLAAHEAVHTWQKGWPLFGLEASVLNEGVPDFVVYDLMGRSANDAYHVYGAANECAVWRSFEADRERGRKAVGDWLYNGAQATGERPADLGYFVGRRIAADYYAQAEDKAAALGRLRQTRRYRRLVKRSDYDGGCE